MERKQQSNLTIFAILTTLAIFTWVFAEAYNTFNKVSLESVPPDVLQKLNPQLDTKTFDLIEKRQVFESVPSGQLQKQEATGSISESTISAQENPASQ